MKVAFLCDSIFSIGGVQRVVTSITNLLCEDYSIDIICTDTNIEVDYTKYGLNFEKINVIYKPKAQNYLISPINKVLKVLNRKFGTFSDYENAETLKKIYFPEFLTKDFINFFNSNDYDIVVGCEGYYSLLISVISYHLKAKTIGWIHNSYDAYFNNRELYYWNMKEIFCKYINRLDEVIVLTYKDKEMFDHNFSIDTTVIYNPISFISEKKSNLSSKNIIAVGRLVVQKGFDMLIKAFSIVKEQTSDWNLTIVGDGPERENLENIIEEYNLEGHVFIEHFTNNIESKYLDSSIYVMSSRWEGFGLVLTEAMEMGLPIISYDVSGPSEIIGNHECGYLVEKNNIVELSNKMLEIMLDEQKRRAFGASSVVRAKDFHSENIKKEWVELFEKLNNYAN